MNDTRYKVYINGTVVANGMDIEIATALIKSLFEKYYNDHSMVIGIREEPAVDLEG